jgi:hypothetical protein
MTRGLKIQLSNPYSLHSSWTRTFAHRLWNSSSAAFIIISISLVELLIPETVVIYLFRFLCDQGTGEINATTLVVRELISCKIASIIVPATWMHRDVRVVPREREDCDFVTSVRHSRS